MTLIRALSRETRLREKSGKAEVGRPAGVHGQQGTPQLTVRRRFSFGSLDSQSF